MFPEVTQQPFKRKITFSTSPKKKRHFGIARYKLVQRGFIGRELENRS